MEVAEVKRKSRGCVITLKKNNKKKNTGHDSAHSVVKIKC